MSAIRWGLFFLALVVTGLIGRTTFDDDLAISLVWPAYGLAAMWLASGNRRWWPVDLAGGSGPRLVWPFISPRVPCHRSF